MLRSTLPLLVAFAMGWASLADGQNADNPWQAVKLPEAATGRTLRGVFFLDAKQGWVVGDQGLCLATRDGGVTWQVIELKRNLLFLRLKPFPPAVSLKD